MASFLSLSVVSGTSFVVDAFMAGDELSMLHYRLRVHAQLASRVVLLESNITPSKLTKPWYVSNTLSPREQKRFNVRIVRGPLRTWREQIHFFTSGHRHVTKNASKFALAGDMVAGVHGAGADSHLTNASQALLSTFMSRDARRVSMMTPNLVTRTALNLAVLEELDAMESAQRNATLILFSDIDEILDPTFTLPTLRALMGKSRCVSAKMRYLVYSEYCHFGLHWARAMLFAAPRLHALLHAAPSTYMRGHVGVETQSPIPDV